MDREKKLTNLYGNKNNKIYMDLKDIIRENALPYLPAKSLLRCSGVCRDWKLLISTPFFAHNQSNSFCSISGFFYQTQAGVPSFMPLDPMAYGVPDPSLEFLPEPVDVRCSCNGLLCCQGRTGYKAYYICNPVTKRWEKLPKPEADHGPAPAVVLAFEPSLLNFTADYKLICAFPSELDGFEFEIYSSGTRSWRISERCQILDSTVGSLGIRNGKLCRGHVNGQYIVVSVLSNAHSNTMQMHSAAKMWKEIPEIHLDLCLPASPSVRWEHVVFIGGDVVLLRDGNMFYCYDMKKKASKNLGEVHIDTVAGIVGYVNSLVEL
ncbi:Anti-Muellerian hormone type-2 receptor [Hibiscus syriacus]|uniref:Anti-Muellerian hormone type-2 receptor n=1 Tax=Hibiscus syriacus TaxID=106335 RepID=A0A6A2XF24_HIBSY|nr:Anti-Muellerian hormone type-2 receptor [Hibiscus syriacus]